MATKTIIIKAPFGGWVSTLSGAASAASPNAGLEGRSDQYSYSQGTTLYRPEKTGHIAPGHVFTAIADSGGYITDLPLNGAIASNSKAFVVLKNSRLVRLSTDGTATEASYDVTVHGGHTGPTSSYNPDVLITKDLATTPVEYVLRSWEDNTDADIGIIKIDGTGQDDDWFSTVPSGGGALTKGVPLKMFNAPDGSVCCTNGSKLAQITIAGAIASATARTAANNYGPGWITTGGCTWKNYAVVIGSKNTGTVRGTVRVWFWNMTDDNFTFSFDIPDNFANGIYADGDTLVALTNGRGNSSKLWEFNGNGFGKEPKFESAFIPATSNPIQGSIESYQRGIVVGYANSSLARIGRYVSGGWHGDSILTDGTNDATEVGMVKNFYQDQLFAGVKYGSSTYKIYYQASFTKYYVNADFRTLLYEIGINGKIVGGRVYFSQFGSGASVLLSLMRGYDTVGIGSGNDQLQKTISYAAQGALKGYHFEKVIADVSSFYMNIRFNHSSVTDTAAIVERLEIDWEPNNL